MAEYDNAGFPLAYCLLTTANVIQIGKRKDALRAWAEILKTKYGINANFVHVNKDMAEIGMVKEVWPSAKISVCWWHMQKSVRERLAKTKLSTTPYLSARTNNVFKFIDISFVPPGQPDRTVYKGGKLPKEYSEQFAPREYPSQTTIKLPPPSQPYSASLKFHIPAISKEDECSKRRFCPEEYCASIVDMLEDAYCAHPLIPGFSNPHPHAIHEWATKQIYLYCVKHDLQEVWAYLWENWLHPGRWELWARSMYLEMISIIKTTMMVEAQ